MSDDKLVFSSPPDNGLTDFYHADNFKVDGNKINSLNVSRHDRMQRNWVMSKSPINQFHWQYKSISFDIDVNQHMHDFFRNKKVLFTLSKNNKLEWISDWIKFYKENHNIDAVLFYDNKSDNYTEQELKDYLLQMKLNVDIIIVPWDFKYGPQGGIWTGFEDAPSDSDFCQYGMMEHAKECFLKFADGVINANIDELMFCTKKGTTIFKELKHSPALLIKGKWIEPIPPNNTLPALFNNFFYYHKDNHFVENKWCVNPQKNKQNAQWQVHSITETKLKLSKHILYALYKAINYNWKTKRADFIELDSDSNCFDYFFYEIMSKHFKCPQVEIPKKHSSFFEKIHNILNAWVNIGNGKVKNQRDWDTA